VEEVVVCDDSSGEAIAAIVRASGDARIAYVRNPRCLGFHGNFAECVRRSHGALLKFLNDDDRLRAGCVERLAAALEGDDGITLATSRRVVIDANGNPAADLPATTPISHVDCVASGIDVGDLALVNGLNLIGEPTTAMFRRRDVEGFADALFAWDGTVYHCLADFSLWLRLLARGKAFYSAEPLSEYRVHAGQEQRDHAGVECITERLELARQARGIGFLREEVQYHAALARIGSLATTWRTSGRCASDDARTLEGLQARIATELAHA
jgi:glycosyltransferase involved in cell wall biosynthesis